MDDQDKDQPQNLPELPINHIAYKILRDNGLNNAEASKALKFVPSNGTLISQKLNQKEDLTSKFNIKLASKAHRFILNHFNDPEKNPIKSSIELKGSDVSKAIDRVYDRVQPVKRSEDARTSISFIQINLGGYE